MSITRMAAQAVVTRNLCRLHRIYKISVGDLKYIGQTNRLPEERFKEHTRESSKCTLLKEALKTNKASLDTLVVVGPHQVDTFERVAIALENSLAPDGLNMTVGGSGVKRRDEKYEKLRSDSHLVMSLLAAGKLISYDILFMKNMISMTEEEFNAVKRLVQ